ncbi:MAG: preprotein translocase subunit SecE [Oscillospiraceae bacterium]|nr:preprotein translocase subunit SecE [Oscillospiraceae bacterium]
MSEQEKRDNAATPQESVSSEKKAKAPKEKKKEKKPNRVLRWLKDLKGELKKVTWPSAKDVVKNVGIVILCVILVGIFIWVFDFLARAVVEALLSLFH